MKRFASFLISLVLFIGFSCQDEPCDEKIESLVGVNFNSIDSTGAVIDTTLPSFTMYSPELQDKLLYDSIPSVNEVFLPLSPLEDESTFVFQIDSIKDTVRFYYSRETKLVSQDCGFRINFYIDSIHFTKTNIDSLHILETTVNSADAKHLEIFFF